MSIVNTNTRLLKKKKVQTKVVMVDITDEDAEYPQGGQWNPLPIHQFSLYPYINIIDYACNKNNSMNEYLKRAGLLKGHLLSKFINELDMQSPCPFNNMSRLLGEITTCPTGETCDVCAERFNLYLTT